MSQHAIVIGTGAGGLTAATALGQRGYEVLALERAKQLGGFLNPFARRHYHFDPGLHYVGQCRPGELIHNVLDRVGIDADEMFCPMDPDGCDLIRFPGFELRLGVGMQAYRDRLASAFPNDIRDIDGFMGMLRGFGRVLPLTTGRPPRLSDVAAVLGLPVTARWLFGTFEALLRARVKNPQLRSVLASQCGDYGLPPSRTPALLGLGVILHFLDGGYFPRRGSGTLRDALVERARAAGVVFRRRAEVTSIRVSRGRAVGVTLADGEEIDAEVVVSAVDPILTYRDLLAGARLPARLQRRVARAEPSVASICVFLGMTRDLRQHGLGAFNVWDYPTWDLEACYEPIARGEMPDEWPFFLSPNSLKDDTGSMAPEGGCTLEVVALAPFAPFAGWQNQPSFKRGPEYAALKEQVGRSLLASVEQRWPELIGDVVVEDVATPVTNIHYANAVHGGIYGPAAIREQFGLNGFGSKTPIPNVILAGAGALGPGVGPCLASGLLAAKLAARAIPAKRRVRAKDSSRSSDAVRAA